MIKKEPYYMLDFSASACLVDIRVNDIQVFCFQVPGQVATRIPINYAIANSGIQEITVKLLPIEGHTFLSLNTEISYEVKLYDVFNGVFVLKDTYDEYVAKKIDEVASFSNSDTFRAEVSYKLSQDWKDGANLKTMEGLAAKIKNAYSDFGEVISNGDFNLFSQLMSKRESNMATSMYLTNLESNSRIEQLINDLNNGFDFMVFDENSIPVISAYGKKVSLRKRNGEPALSFINKTINKEIVLDVEFYFSKETYKFEII